MEHLNLINNDKRNLQSPQNSQFNNKNWIIRAFGHFIL